MCEPRRRRFGAGTIVLIVVGLLVMVILTTRQSRTLGLRQTLQFDDFFFTVLEAGRLPADSMKASQAKATSGSVNYLVKLKIENRARRVPFVFSGDSLAFADVTGKNGLSRPSAERTSSGELQSPVRHTLQAGESATIDYIFSLPPELENLRLRIAPGGWSGDLLEWLLFGRKEFQLP